MIRGRVLAIEEVDTSKTSWLGRIVLELVVADSQDRRGAVDRQFDETEPVRCAVP